MNERDEIRAFIAIELPAGLKSRLKDFEQKLRTPETRCAKWVDPGSIHLTLKFLGNVKVKTVEEIKQGLMADASGGRPFTLKTAETGCFPNLRRPRVFWMGLSGDVDRLLELQARIDESTARLGFPREERPFTGHLTLARLRDDCTPADRSAFTEFVGGFQMEPFSVPVAAVSLIRSQLRPEGAVYTRLAECRLGGN